jgi:RecB family exonuclease
VLPRRFSYSGLSSYLSCGLRYRIERLLQMGNGGVRPGALALGSAVHAVLELYGECAAIDRERVEAICRFHQLDANGRERVMEAVERYRRSTLAMRVASFETVRREAPFAIWIGGDEFVLDGSMDVYATSSDGTLIVDYKSGTRDATDVELLADYELQARCYALAAARAGRPSVEVVFVRPEVDDAGQPQQVTYRFGPDDALRTEQRLLGIYDDMRAGRFESRGVWSHASCVPCALPPELCAVKRSGC